MKITRIAWDEVDGVAISTVVAWDTEKPETAVAVGGSWTIVQDYLTVEAARAGHRVWVERVRAGQREFTEIRSPEEQMEVILKLMEKLAEGFSEADFD